MKRLSKSFALAFAFLVLAAAAPADDLTGQQSFLCTPVQVAICGDNGECAKDAPWELNIPQFIQMDLAGKKLSTTPASGENRSTPILSVARENGEIYLQGVELGRAFSFVIDEKTGMFSAAVARAGIAVSAFGACTPMPPSK
jgi:hypothetical protein